jgi:hypothetical protein
MRQAAFTLIVISKSEAANTCPAESGIKVLRVPLRENTSTCSLPLNA